MAATNGNRQPETIEQYIKAHPDADPKALLDVLLQQNVRIREEYRITSEVEIDDNLNFKPKSLAQLQRLARMYAESGMVPDHYKGNIANCAIGVQMALRCKVDILTFLQSSYIVHGKPGLESKLAIAMLNSSGQIKGRVRFKMEGEGKQRRCTAFAVDAATGETLSQTVDWEMVEAEGWDKKSGSKWKTLPDLMFQYRSAIFLIRVFFPDVLMGMYSLDELEDTDPARDLKKPAAMNNLDDLASHLMGGRVESAVEVEAPTVTETAESTETAPEPTQEATQETAPPESDPVLIENAERGFLACKDLASVTKFADEQLKLAKSPADKTAIEAMEQLTKDRIRESRDKSSKGGQGKLSGVS